MTDVKVLNPFDAEGLEKSLSDSATRVSTIWITYLLFGLYLLVTAGTASDKQLLLADPVKLPALGTDVPLVSFFLLSPVFFVLLQIYVLLQTLLLGRTAQAYNDAVDAALPDARQNATFRERLANTIFAQIFSGAPRERDGWVGMILRAIRWFTLIGSPILVLLTFQRSFLPYHSQGVTWVHRILIYSEIAMAFMLWPAVVDPAKEFSWRGLDLRFWRSSFGSMKQLGEIAAILVILVSTFALSFPGEWLINILSFQTLDHRSCTRWIPAVFDLDKKIIFDRLLLKDVNIVDADGFEKLNKDAPKDMKMYDGARSKELSDRDFACGQFDGVDFRRAALENARFDGSYLTGSRFDGAKMTNANFEGAYLNGATLSNVKLDQAHLRNAKLYKATLNGVDVTYADLRGIDLSDATLIGVIFGGGARLSGANLSGLKTNGNALELASAHLEGASLQYSDLTKATLSDAIMDGADFNGAQLPAAMPALPKSAFKGRPPDWDNKKTEQIQLANDVADTVCASNLPDTKVSFLKDNRTEIVAGMITNALFPRRDDPTCVPNPTGLASTCPVEQPEAYRVRLAERLGACSVKVLSTDENNYLRNGDFAGHFAKRP